MPPPSFNPGFYSDFGSLVQQKYDILAKEAEGTYQRNTSEAYKAREEGGQVAPNAAALRALQAAEAYRSKQMGLSEEAGRYLTPQGADMMHRQLYPESYQPGAGAIQPQEQHGYYHVDPSTQQLGPSTQQPYMPRQIPLPGGETIYHGPPPFSYSRQSQVEPQNLPRRTQELSPGQQIAQRPVQLPSFISQSSSGYGGGLRKGSANVKGKDGRAKSAKSGDQPKGGLETILPALMAAAQGGGAGPQAPLGGPPQAPGGSPQGPGFARGTPNVRRYAEGTDDTTERFGKYIQGAPAFSGPSVPAFSGPKVPEQNPAITERFGKYIQGVPEFSGPSVPAFSGPKIPEQSSGGEPDPLMSGMAGIMSGGAIMNARGNANVRAPAKRSTVGMARGAARVQPKPNYPFGAGYLFGATAVPGQGSGTVDTVPAMLAPHEAVLNRAAADMLGRGLISVLNKAGTQRMGMR